jgi:hypothetical protein
LALSPAGRPDRDIGDGLAAVGAASGEATANDIVAVINVRRLMPCLVEIGSDMEISALKSPQCVNG